jgi:hypothetical protein
MIQGQVHITHFLHLGSSLSSSRLIMMRITSLVPSRMLCTRKSRMYRSIGYSWRYLQGKYVHKHARHAPVGNAEEGALGELVQAARQADWCAACCTGGVGFESTQTSHGGGAWVNSMQAAKRTRSHQAAAGPRW